MASSSKSAFISDDIAKYVNSCCEDDNFVEDIGEGCPSGSDQECPIKSELESDCSDVFVPLKHKRVPVIIESSDSYSTCENVEDLHNSSFPVFIETQLGQDLYVQSSLSFLESPGPKHAPPQDAKPIEYFDMFFTLALWNLMVAETNSMEISFCVLSSKYHPVLESDNGGL
uniref:PiggyBac transposable element-derived protein domain-containing protein n=1 Tax=Myotis myotis TaxID=51298 RepID=A0A7J7VI22_MYOMY|nr:hypothetical protein mMyoMyo1_008268 [Myotis myotis]